MAKVYLDCLIKRLRREEGQYVTFFYAIFSTGGYLETSTVALETKHRIFNGLTVFAVVDKDALETMDENVKLKQLYENTTDTIKALDITPELWYCDILKNNQTTINRAIAEQYHCDIHRITQNEAYWACNSQKPRKKAKAKFDVIVDEIMRNGCISEEQATIGIIKILVEAKDIGAIKSVVLAMITIVSYHR